VKAVDFFLIAAVVGLAVAIDFAVGDPHVLPHPVNLIAKWIEFLEQRLRRLGRLRRREAESGDEALEGRRLRKRGVLLCFLTIAMTSGCVIAILICLRVAGVFACSAGCVYFIYSGLAARCLDVESRKVYSSLKEGNIPVARERIGMLVGRETEALDQNGIIQATVETIAENTSDAVISPLFWMTAGLFAGYFLFGRTSVNALICGATALWAFKATSTLDSVVGYKNERYIDMGRASAKTDDVLNFLPARITGLLIVIAFGLRMRNMRVRKMRACMQIMRRDHARHASPNSGWPEAAIAGALGIELGGGAFYSGVWVEKPLIGDKTRALMCSDILMTLDVMWICEVLALALIFAGVAVTV